MSFFNDLGKKTTETTAKIATEAKLKIEIAENKERIKDLYIELGRKIYENHVREEDLNIHEFISDDCSKIDEISKQIEEARREILVLNNKKMCKKCYAEIETTYLFCPECGEKQKEEKTILEKAEEKLDKSDISSENQREAKIVKEELQQKNKEN